MPAGEQAFLHEVVPRWTWPGEPTTNFSFYIPRSRGLGYVLTDARGEGFVKDVFRLLGTSCASETRPPLIIDVGANTGYYSILAATLGCPVVAFEPQPGCRPSFDAAEARNALAPGRIRFIPRPVSSRTALIEVPAHGCAVTNQAKIEVGAGAPSRGRGRGRGRGRRRR